MLTQTGSKSQKVRTRNICTCKRLKVASMRIKWKSILSQKKRCEINLRSSAHVQW